MTDEKLPVVKTTFENNDERMAALLLCLQDWDGKASKKIIDFYQLVRQLYMERGVPPTLNEMLHLFDFVYLDLKRKKMH